MPWSETSPMDQKIQFIADSKNRRPPGKNSKKRKSVIHVPGLICYRFPGCSHSGTTRCLPRSGLSLKCWTCWTLP